MRNDLPELLAQCLMRTTYRIDIDGTIALPRFYHEDLQECANWYVREGIVKSEEIASLQFHQQLFLLPHVLITHQAIEGAVQALQELNTQGKTLQYFTVRQNFNPVICEQVHRNTSIWLEQQHFPCPMDVHFFWNQAEKLLASLEAQEEKVLLIDDRPNNLIKAYTEIAQNDLDKAQQIRQRVTVVAFGCADTDSLDRSGLRVVPLMDWSTFYQLTFS